ncbi:MAG: hypothetical protein K1X79_05970 [Oligoflexia bacterium]|nr:hypothetical protein [Oligoflexia bacterium]
MRLETRSSNLAPAIAEQRDLVSSPVESTEIIEHPRAREEQETHERARHILRHWAFMVSGVILGAALIIFVRLSSHQQEVATQLAAPAAVEQSTAIKVSASEAPALQQPASQSAQAAAPVTEQQPVLQANSQPESLSIVEHAKGRPVGIEPRKFLFVSEGLRTYDSTLIPANSASSLEGRGGAAPALSLRPLDGGAGRYQLNGTNVEWQGAWQADDPAYNLRLGGAYTDYLNRTFGNGAVSSLSAINKEPTNLLGKTARPATQLSAPKTYSK